MDRFNQLSDREWEVIKQLLQAKSNKLIASSLVISDSTVEFHLKNIYDKLQVCSRIELIIELWKATGKVDFEKLGKSTVDELEESAENGNRATIRQLQGVRNIMRAYRLILAASVASILFPIGSLVYITLFKPGHFMVWRGIIPWFFQAVSITVLLLFLPRKSFQSLLFIAYIILMFLFVLPMIFTRMAPVSFVPYLIGAAGILVASKYWAEENPEIMDTDHA